MNQNEKIDYVLKAICEYYSLDFNILTNRNTGVNICRKTEYVWARWVFYKWTRDNTKIPLEQIGAYFHSKNTPIHYSTVIHGLNKLEEEIAIYPKIAKQYYTLCEQFEFEVQPKEVIEL